jgi:hypothetical protein
MKRILACFLLASTLLLGCADEKVSMINKRNSAIRSRNYPAFLSTWSAECRQDREAKGPGSKLEWNMLTSDPPVLRKVLKVGPDYVTVDEMFNGDEVRARYTFVRERGHWKIDNHSRE